MDDYLPWLIILAMAVFAIHGLRHRKAELTAADRRNLIFGVVLALILPIVVLGYPYLR